MSNTIQEMTEQITLRQETADDFKAVFEVHRGAFKRDDEARLVETLRNNRATFIPELSLVATTTDGVVGHILFTRIKIVDDEKQEAESLALAPMAVRPGFQKRGIGRQLVQTGLEIARRLGFSSVIVLGHEHYYPKFGFEPAVKWGIRAPFDVPQGVFMALELVPDGLKKCSGTVIYPKAFKIVG